MSISRRDLIVAGGTLAMVSGCSKLAIKVAGRKLPEDVHVPKDSEPTRKLLDRVAFGPTPGDVARVKAMGHAAYVEEQLNPTDDDPMLGFLLSRLDVNRLTASDLRDLHEDVVLVQLRQSSILSPIYSRWQLRERMVDFWLNHFNIFAHKNYGTYRKAVDNVKVIRANALGNFATMVHASAHSPAMLGYLDNQINKKGVVNENYGRELLELHTLGVHGGYSYQDVKETARCFTGWTIEDRSSFKVASSFETPNARENFRFNPELHDDDAKVVLGHTIPKGGGYQDGLKVLDIVTTHPSTAKYIAGKLCRYFLGDAEDPARDAATKAFLDSGGDIKATLRPILESDSVAQGAPILKRPFDYAVSAVRSLGGNCDGARAFQEHLDLMGQGLYSWPMPDGYPDRTSAWTGSLLGRWNFATALCGGKIEGSTIDFEGLGEAIEANVLGSQATRLPGDASTRAALALASPDFQWR